MIAMDEGLSAVHPGHKLHRLLGLAERKVPEDVRVIFFANHRVEPFDDLLVHMINACEMPARIRAVFNDVRVTKVKLKV